MLDEREESLREMAAIGNFKAVYLYLRNGVNVNSVNKINGWSPLHWASHRNQAPIVKLLLLNQADTSIKNNKGQTAMDLATTNAVREAFGLAPNEEETTKSTEETKFVPNYISTPDLGKLWSIPDDVVEPKVKIPFEKLEQALTSKVEETITEVKAPPTAQPVPNTTTSETSVSTDNSIKELIVSLKCKESHRVLGAIFISPSSSISKAVEMIVSEIDDIPEDFKVARCNKNREHIIPISNKQMEQPINRHFRDEEEQLVLVPLVSSELP
ncbi:hypothetical protein K7432_016016 [Basidiobolus ranarum]|uniref:Uncharacterized protein n=1 Tax=Basidiobolus ranarum TaxID=34480 RepID=A0ABR2WFD3_9FUNG